LTWCGLLVHNFLDMEFKASLTEIQASQVIQLLEMAVRAGGIQTARVAIPIVDDLAAQAQAYNRSLAEASSVTAAAEPKGE